MSHYRLLTQANPKTLKGERRGYLTFILHLAPYTLAGHNVCPKATAGCIASCLNLAGRGGILKAGESTNAIQVARVRRTQWFFSDRRAFMAALVSDVERAIAYAKRKGLRPVFRLNGTSDIRWERIPVERGRFNYGSIMDAFKRVQFYDYTKIANRRDLPPNYALTFSLAENNAFDAMKALRSGINVAAVFRSRAVVERVLSERYWAPLPLMPGMDAVRVYDGDESDLRFRDPRSRTGNVIALYAKGPARRDQSGFVQDR